MIALKRMLFQRDASENVLGWRGLKGTLRHSRGQAKSLKCVSLVSISRESLPGVRAHCGIARIEVKTGMTRLKPKCGVGLRRRRKTHPEAGRATGASRSACS